MSLFLASMIIFYIIRSTLRFRSRQLRRIHLMTYMKIIDYAFHTLHQNKEQCLKRLDEVQREITELFRKGELDEWKYEVLNKKISVYLSSLQVKDVD